MQKLTPVALFAICNTLTSVTGTAATDRLTKNAHGMVTGDPFIITFGSGFTGLTSGKRYYAIFIDANNIKVATNLANALAGTAIDITVDGAGGAIALATRFLTPSQSNTGTLAQTVKGGTFAAQVEGNAFTSYVGVKNTNGNFDARAALPQILNVYWTQGGYDLANYWILAAAGDGVDFLGHY